MPSDAAWRGRRLRCRCQRRACGRAARPRPAAAREQRGADASAMRSSSSARQQAGSRSLGAAVRRCADGPTLTQKACAAMAQYRAAAAAAALGQHAGGWHAPGRDLGRVDRGPLRGVLCCDSCCGCACCRAPWRAAARRPASQRARAALCGPPCARAAAPCALASLRSHPLSGLLLLLPTTGGRAGTAPARGGRRLERRRAGLRKPTGGQPLATRHSRSCGQAPGSAHRGL